jgi:UDP-glucose 4-epimerase
MKCLVTGGCGFIGSHLVDRLVEMGHQVVVVDNESSTANETFHYNKLAVYFMYDIADYTAIRPLMKDVDYVFHLAAESRIMNTIDNPLLCFNTNIYGTGVVLQAAREAGVKKVIYSSTSSAYGLLNSPPQEEKMIEDCLNPYSVSKVAGEKMCKMYTDLFGLKTIVFRYFNVYGPREPIKGPYAPVVGLFMRQHRAGDILTITGDGKQRRDFVHVNDVVEANIRAMLYAPKEMEKDYHGELFNIGSGKSYSVLELAKMIDGRYAFIDARPGEAKETLADIKKASRILKWAPKEDLIQYVKEQLNR